ncbi:hypothetical protein FBU30_004652 [Linnemannia zychae]|nr:hypothetical protein FBU30_004652 [Linnemannia zychae]
MMGIFLHRTGCPKRVIEVLSGLGLSLSHSQLQNGLRSLTEHALERITTSTLPTNTRRDTFGNGTAATVVLFPGDKGQGGTARNVLFRPENGRPVLGSGLFFSSELDLAIFYRVSLSHVSNAIVRSLPEESAISAISTVYMFPLQIMKLDESTIAGSLAVLERIMKSGFQPPESWIAHPDNTVVAGDQMS